MHQPYPAGAPDPQQQRPAPPASILAAARLMYAGAVVSALSLIATLATISQLRTALHNADPALSAARLHTAEIAAVIIALLVGLIGVGLWIWMAAANKAGKNWARITASVIFGLDTLAVIADFTRPEPLLNRLVSAVIWLIGLGVIALLWRRDSRAYYTASQGP